MGNSPITQPTPTPAPVAAPAASQIPDVLDTAISASLAKQPRASSSGADVLDGAISDSLAGRPVNTGTTNTPDKPSSLTWGNVGSGVVAGLGDVGRVALGMVPGGPAETGILKSVWDNLPPVKLANSVKQTLPLIDAYEKSRASGASISDSIKAANDTGLQHISNISPLSAVVAAFHANPTRETARALTDAAALAASLLVGGGAAREAAASTPEVAAAAPEASAAVEPTAVPEAADFGSASKPGLVQNVKSLVHSATASPAEVGETAAQPIAQAGVQSVAPTVGPSLRSGIDVQTPFSEAKTLYQTVDNAAKTNFKDLYTKLDAAQDDARLAASGSPEEAKAQLNIKNTQDAIDDAKAIAAKSGVPDVDKTLAQADAKFTVAQANKDFNSKFFGSQGVVQGNVAHGAPETINIDKAIDVLENMDKPNKYGASRLQQTSLGKDGAFKLKQALYDAQQAGKTAMDARSLRNTILKWTGIGGSAVLGLGYELTK